MLTPHALLSPAGGLISYGSGARIKARSRNERTKVDYLELLSTCALLVNLRHVIVYETL